MASSVAPAEGRQCLIPFAWPPGEGKPVRKQLTNAVNQLTLLVEPFILVRIECSGDFFESPGRFLSAAEELLR
jgi:hypothetical protein